MDGAAGAGARLPPRCVPPGRSISGNWQRERSAALARCSQHLDTYITGNASKRGKKKISRRGGFFFFFFCTFKYFFSPPSCFSSFWVSRCREPLPCRERWKDGEAAKCRRGAGGSCPHPRSRSGGSHGAAPTGTPHPGGPWHTWVPSLSLPSCDTGRGSGRGDTARGAPGGSGDLRPMGTAGAAGGSGGSGIGTRPGKSCPTWAG